MGLVSQSKESRKEVGGEFWLFGVNAGMRDKYRWMMTF